MKLAAHWESVVPGIALGLALALAPPSHAQQCVDLPEGAVAWWPGDGNEAELESGLDAKRVAGADFAPGLVGDAFRMDGVAGGQDDRVVLPRLAADGLADLTVEFWVNTTDTTAGLFSAANGNASSANELLLFQGTGGLVVWVNNAQSGSIPVFVNDGAWHHVALVRDGDMGSLFVDGQLIDMRAYPSGPLEVGPLGLLLGQDQDCLGGCFQAEQALDGAMDELTIYGRALAATEVADLYAAGAAGKCKPPAPPMPPAPGQSEDVALALEAIALLEEEMTLVVDRLVAIDAALGLLEASVHSHEPRKKPQRRWRRDRDDDDDDRRHRRKKHRRHKHKH